MDYLSSLCLSVFIKKILFIEIGFQSQKDASSKFRSKHLFFLGGVDAGASQKRGEMDHPQRKRDLQQEIKLNSDTNMMKEYEII